MGNRAKQQSKTDGKTFLRERLIGVEELFVVNLKQHQASITHDGSMGDATEDAWIGLLRDYLPGRYKVAKAFAVDHEGKTTDQLDCLVYDAHFTPALFGKDKHLYVPAEAVYATFEIKQSVDPAHIKAAAAKAASLRALARTSVSLESSHGKNPAKPTFHILAGLLAMNATWTDGLGKTFSKHFAAEKADRKLDLVLTAEHGFCDHLSDASVAKVVSGRGALIRGLFRFLKALRSRASVPGIDWDKYESVLE